VTFVYVSKDNKFGLLHSHTKVIPPEGQACDAEIVGLLSDKINGNVDGKIDSPPNPFNCLFVFVAPILAPVVLKSLMPSHPTQSTSPMEHPPTPTPSWASLVPPAFVNLPVLLPVPTGTALPISKSIAHGIPAPPEGKNWWPPFLFWMECIHYLFKRNNGNPVTSTAPKLSLCWW
jgi:hypothetical protein